MIRRVDRLFFNRDAGGTGAGATADESVGHWSLAASPIDGGRRRLRGAYIPVVVDSIRRGREFEMIRCNYLTVDCGSSQLELTLKAPAVELPVQVFQLGAVVLGPVGRSRFRSVDEIAALYETIEDRLGLSIDADDLWLPLSLVRGKPRRSGTTYRLHRRLFSWALHFREGRISREQFEAFCLENRTLIFHSARETAVFREWFTSQVDQAKSQYPKRKELALDRKSGETRRR